MKQDTADKAITAWWPAQSITSCCKLVCASASSASLQPAFCIPASICSFLQFRTLMKGERDLEGEVEISAGAWNECCGQASTGWRTKRVLQSSFDSLQHESSVAVKLHLAGARKQCCSQASNGWGMKRLLQSSIDQTLNPKP